MATTAHGTAWRRAIYDPIPDAKEVILSRKEIALLLESGARKRLRMSAKQMIQAFRRGKLKEPCRIGDLLAYASLLDPRDALYARP